MAIGIVGASARATNAVAPNSPSEIAAANVAEAIEHAPHDREVDLEPRSTGRGAEDCGRVALARVDAAEAGQHRAQHERDRDRRLRDRDEPPRGCRSIGRFKAMMKPKPIVTAETPSGSRSNSCSTPRAPRRRARVTTIAASPPTTTASTVAASAARTDVAIVDAGDADNTFTSVPSERYAPTPPLSDRATITPTGASRNSEDHAHEQRRRPSGAKAGGTAPRHRGAPTRRLAPPSPLHPAGRPARDRQGEQHDEHLHDDERARAIERELLRGEPVDLGLDRAVLRPAEHEHHAERGHAEQEDDRRGRHDRVGERRERGLAERAQRRRARYPGDVDERRVEVRPSGTDDAHDHSEVEPHVGQDDRGRARHEVPR